jgi:hypothetical protein
MDLATNHSKQARNASTSEVLYQFDSWKTYYSPFWFLKVSRLLLSSFVVPLLTGTFAYFSLHYRVHCHMRVSKNDLK